MIKSNYQVAYLLDLKLHVLAVLLEVVVIGLGCSCLALEHSLGIYTMFYVSLTLVLQECKIELEKRLSQLNTSEKLG